MNHKLLTIIAALAAQAAYVSYAAEPTAAGGHGEHAQPGEQATADTPTMDKMQEHMQAMQETMRRIHGTTDPAARQKLMKEHMQSMREAMAIMEEHGADCCGHMAQERTAAHAPDCKSGDATCERMKNLEAENQRMRNQMGMMHGMMRQMMEHEAVNEEAHQ